MSKRRFSRTNLGPVLFALLLLMNSDGSIAAESLQAEIRFQPGRAGTVWVGQELELNLDLFSNGFSFGGQQFILPEVSGAYLLQADSSTVKLTEKRGGESWQGLRYSFLLYPQRQGLLNIPSFEVSFTASAGYGQETESFRFDTGPLSIEAKLPPGADGTGLLVSSADFSVRTEWKPQPSDEDVMQLKVGDALSLTINRQATAVPGMVFSPLPEFSIEGLQAYPEAPRVNDRINRGELIGTRTDSLTFICQREGSYEIPGIRFQWWDPGREVLNEEISPGLSFEVIPNPAYGAAQASAAGRRSMISWKQLLLGIAVLALLLITGWKASGPISRQMQQRRERRQSGEAWAFRQALNACASATPREAYAAVTLWTSRFEPANGGLTLLQLAKASGEHELHHEAERLQLAVVSGAEQGWNGAQLGRLLRDLRASRQHRPAKQYGLVALNPK